VKNTLVVSRCLDLLRKLIERIERKFLESRKEEYDRRPRSDLRLASSPLEDPRKKEATQQAVNTTPNSTANSLPNINASSQIQHSTYH